MPIRRRLVTTVTYNRTLIKPSKKPTYRKNRKEYFYQLYLLRPRTSPTLQQLQTIIFLAQRQYSLQIFLQFLLVIFFQVPYLANQVLQSTLPTSTIQDLLDLLFRLVINQFQIQKRQYFNIALPILIRLQKGYIEDRINLVIRRKE